MRLYGADITGSLQTTGSISLSGSFKDQESSSGTAGQVLSSTVSGSQWVDASSGDVIKTGTIVANQIAIWNNTTNQLRSDPTFVIDSDHKITLYQPNSSNNDRSSYNIGGGNIDNVTGQFNTGFGKNNLTSIVAGSQNIAIGANALSTNTDGDFNIAVGYNSLLSLTTGASNTAYGNQTLQANTYASQNSAFGTNALILNVSGASNTALGYLSLGANTSGPNNVAVGALALRNSTGTTNTAIGHSAGSAITTGDNNVIIGTNTGSTIATSDNNIIISDGDGNNRLQFGSTGAATFKATTPSPVVSTPIVSIADSVNGVLGGIGALASGGYPLQIWGGTLEFKTGSSSNIATATTKLTIASGGLTQINSTSTTALELITNQSASSLRLKNTGSIVADWIMQSGGITAGDLSFYNLDTSAYRLTITSGGNVGIGTTSPFGTTFNRTCLSVNGATDASINMGVGDVQKAYFYTSATETHLSTVSAMPLSLDIAGVPKLTISSGGEIQVGGDAALVFGTNNATDPYIQAASSGDELFFGRANGFQMAIRSDNVVDFKTGIRFINGGNTTLDAYEEGNWTPTMNTSQGNLATFTSSGTYTRIGRLVSLQITYTLTATGTPTPSGGAILVQNIPFSKIGNEAFVSGFGQQPSAGKSLIAFQYASGNTTIGIYRGDGNFAGALNEVSIITVQYLTP